MLDPVDASVRAAAVRDAAAITSTFLAARAQMDYLPLLHSREETAWWITDEILGTLNVQVCETPGEIIGFAAMSAACLEHLYVGPSYQGRGVGRRLLNWAKTESPGRLQLWVFQPNRRAIAFYERHGFVVVVRTDGSRNQENVPDVLMEWDDRH